MDDIKFHIFVNRPAPDRATQERIIKYIEEQGWIDRAIKSLKNEKISRNFAIIFAIIGFFFPIMLIMSAIMFFNALLNVINFNMLLHLMRKYYEDNC